LRLPTAKLQLNDNLEEEKLRLPTAKSDEEWQTPAERLSTDFLLPILFFFPI
jgi:hypothetical protein